MKLLNSLRNRRNGGVVASADAGSAETAGLPFPGYDKLDHRQVGARLGQLTQVELAAVESYERSHEDRPEVLNKLRYMVTSEPLQGYDALSAEQIVTALATADTRTVKAVRDYERKFGARAQVMEAAARVLPQAKASAGEDQAVEAKAERVKQGFANLDKTARDLEG